MLFDSPLPWPEVVKFLAGLRATPTASGSAELSTLPAEIRQLSLFSARTTSAGYLEHVRQILQDYTAGKINMADAVMKCQEWLRHAGYTPEGGFPGEEPTPPANTLLQNLASSPRIKLVVETLARRAQSTANLEQGMSASRRYNFPCWEFHRRYYKRVPRGSTGKDNDPAWQERWVRSGGTLYDGRMIATKDDDVWDAISDSGVWPDGLDSDSDPVVFNTGYGRVELPRQECVDLGVIDAEEGVQARKIDLLGQMFGDPAKATVADVNTKRAALLDALAHLEDAA